MQSEGVLQRFFRHKKAKCSDHAARPNGKFPAPQTCRFLLPLLHGLMLLKWRLASCFQSRGGDLFISCKRGADRIASGRSHCPVGRRSNLAMRRDSQFFPHTCRGRHALYPLQPFQRGFFGRLLPLRLWRSRFPTRDAVAGRIRGAGTSFRFLRGRVQNRLYRPPLRHYDFAGRAGVSDIRHGRKARPPNFIRPQTCKARNRRPRLPYGPNFRTRRKAFRNRSDLFFAYALFLQFGGGDSLPRRKRFYGGHDSAF